MKSRARPVELEVRADQNDVKRGCVCERERARARERERQRETERDRERERGTVFGHLKLDQERKSRGQGHEHVCPKVQQPATMIRLQVRGKMYKALVGDDDGVLVRRAQQFELQERELFVRDIRDVIARKHGRAFGSAAWMRGVPRTVGVG